MDRLCLYAKNIMKKINQKYFKKVLGKFATGVTVISINNKEKFIGKTVNSFSALSLSPPLVLFSLDRKASSIIKFKNCEYLSINILNKKQINISKNFSEKNAPWNKTDVSYYFSKNKTPIIKNCLANLECKKIKFLTEGDHIIFICKVINFTYNDNLKPLLYFNSKYI